MPYGKKSPAEMGHSPMKKESAKQEKKNLLKDMPIDDKASALEMGHSPLEGHCMGSPAKMGHESPMKMAGSWMSKHSQSALHMGHSPVKMGHSPLEKKVKVNYKGKELTLDDRSPEYKHIMKTKKGNKQVATKVVMDKSGTSYTGFSKA